MGSPTVGSHVPESVESKGDGGSATLTTSCHVFSFVGAALTFQKHPQWQPLRHQVQSYQRTGTNELNGIAFYLKEWKLVLRTIIAILFPPLKCATIKNAKTQWYLFTYLPNTICCEEIGLEIK